MADGVVDALSSQPNARSVAELSLAASFQRTYSRLYKSIAACSLSNGDLARLGAPQLPAPAKRNFWWLAADVSSHPRRYSEKLADRGCVRAYDDAKQRADYAGTSTRRWWVCRRKTPEAASQPGDTHLIGW
ncbi:MAG: hypothetical protein JXR84_05610 [Anaerolineae bacterium]|nr:hypothetical protein [Anaerolineae bacterium]